ncbi:MAG: radical SAM protein, partial [Candidatus Micrarchaeota archaeon]
RSGCESISFTYNEPTIFTEYALDVMKLARKKGLKGVYVTNGYESKECWDAIKGSIDAVNIDLKAFTERFYRETCRVPSIGPVKESIRRAKEMGFWVEVTTLFIPGLNDSEKEMKDIASFLAGIDKEMPWHATAFYPAYKLMDKEPTPPETLVRAREIGLAAGLKHVYCGNVSASYSEYETTYCPNPECGKPLIKRVYFSVEKDDIKGGKCRFCKTPVNGVWR